MKKKIFVSITLLLVVSSFIGLLYPKSFSKYMKNCTSITVIYVKNNIEQEPCITKVFEKDTKKFTELKEIISDFSFHHSLRSFSNDTALSNNLAGYWLYIYINVGEKRTILTCGGTGEIFFDDHIYRIGYWGNKTALTFMNQIVKSAINEQYKCFSKNQFD